MRHAQDPDLDRLQDLLEALRSVGDLRERKRGNFTFRSRPFLHFHADGDALYADVRLDGTTFDRHPVSTPDEQERLVAAIAAVVAPDPQ